MWSLPTCAVCEQEINVPHRYKVAKDVYMCPDCMSDAMNKITRTTPQPLADAIWDFTTDMMEVNDPLFTDYDPDLGFGSFKEE